VKILADYHHSDLYESLELLADRFGWQVYRPIGMEWFHEWYWNFERAWHGDAVAKQYLSHWDGDTVYADHSERADSTHPGRRHKMVTLEQAKSTRWDVILASLPSSERGFAKLRKETNSGTYGVQIGNNGQIRDVEWDLADFGLVSSTLNGDHIPKPHVVYRQEFSLSDFRHELSTGKDVASFIQCFAENKSYYTEFLSYARDYPHEFDWRVYGAYGSHPEDEFAAGNLPNTPTVADAMRSTRIAWHAKWWGDGFGHVIHNLGATGTPIVGPIGYYADKLAGEWMEPETCFDTAQRSRVEVVDLLRRLRDDEDFYRGTSARLARRFREVVDFDADAEKVKALLESVL
jgi:glycosyltransferase involved in cell wall biosynthesis